MASRWVASANATAEPLLFPRNQAMSETTKPSAASALRTVSLADRYLHRSGTILISGVQALVRLMLMQADRDASAGRKTGGFVSGYRGSPLGTLDTAFKSAVTLTEERGIVVKPAVNEELAATAIAGSQQIARTPAA